MTDVKAVGGFAAVVVEGISIEAGTPVYNSPSLVVVDREGRVLMTSTLTGSFPQPAVLRIEGSNVTISHGSLSLTLDVSTIR